MRKVLLDEALEVQAKMLEMENKGFIGIRSWSIQMRVGDFIKTFDEYEIRERDCDIYPWELVTEYNGVEFIALFDAEEAEEYGIQVQEQTVQMDV